VTAAKASASMTGAEGNGLFVRVLWGMWGDTALLIISSRRCSCPWGVAPRIKFLALERQER
jgi:hypothetical protein